VVEPRPPSLRYFVEEVGRNAYLVWSDMKALVSFVGEITAALASVALHPLRMRWRDAFLTAEAAGANALPVVAMLGFLIGLILAFQCAIPLSYYGAELFVADLVAFSVLRELGPLITAIILAGRTGSAFAAELGTMKVNEELDALTTMGLDPVRWLAPTRVVAVIVVTPILTVFCNVFGLIGGAVFMRSRGILLTTYVGRIQSMIGATDVLGGLAKAAVFGLLVAAIGCLRGMQTGTGARAVGQSATRAVVSGIVLIVLADAVFGVLFYLIGI
jgi:phospholipid/cholesterol/gamma-HCH transport system permease protein